MCTYLHKGFTQVEPFLNELAVLLQEGAEEQAQVLDEVLLVILPVGVRQTDVCVQRQHLRTNQTGEQFNPNLHHITHYVHYSF